MTDTQTPKPAGQAAKRRMLTGAVLALALAAGYGAYKASESMGPMVGSNGNEIGGRFRLMDSSDGTMTDTSFRGRWMLVLFGATHCVDNACDKTLMQLSRAINAVDPGGKAFAPIFVSLDPQRDQSSELRQYALKFPAKIIAGTGAPATLDAVAKEFHAPIEKRPDPVWEYAYVMSPQIVIMDPQGHYAGTLSSAAEEPEMETRLRSLLAGPHS
ncbi:electron transport transmembrane protein Sco1/SenC/PrrC [Acetobacter estunensis NRIC 0472]|uniref:SCO family protein n=1 Tax=Acetobacter estunensis TaxID=104097 RepID=A0A967BB23_9PROT|nr:SCO family protein [Acetobacter estunensis]NHO53763.1 SCO family protein [Acetobacter estunensis]GBQ20128.1 electron transport transmembrane protein Sco1/SenC/PrrC [Acetobacter estunensis NRIC 0472]